MNAEWQQFILVYKGWHEAQLLSCRSGKDFVSSGIWSQRISQTCHALAGDQILLRQSHLKSSTSTQWCNAQLTLWATSGNLHVSSPKPIRAWQECRWCVACTLCVFDQGHVRNISSGKSLTLKRHLSKSQLWADDELLETMCMYMHTVYNAY